MKTLIAGNRRYTLTKEDKEWLERLPITEVFCGEPNHFDGSVGDWAIRRNK